MIWVFDDFNIDLYKHNKRKFCASVLKDKFLFYSGEERNFFAVFHEKCLVSFQCTLKLNFLMEIIF